jgi:glutamine synthetase adenylyltransferase
VEKVKLLDEKTIRSEIIKMLESVHKEVTSSATSFNIKKQKGGLMGIDFILQSLALADVNHFRNCMNKNIPKIISYFTRKGYKDFDELKNNYKNLRTLEFTILNLFNTNSPIIPVDKSKKKLLEVCLDLTCDLDQYISNIIKSNNTFLEKYLGR